LYDLAHLSLRQMTECGIVLRTLHARATSLEDVSQLIVQHLYDEMRAAGERACVLVRAYRTRPYATLDAGLQAFARELAGGEPAPETRCLTLLATIGDEPEWNSRYHSRGHRAIPLDSVEAVQRLPMMSQLVAQLGIDVQAIVQPDRRLIMDLQQRTFSVFYVGDARTSPHIPVQEFVHQHGVRSVLAFGSVLPSGDLFAVILFARVHVPRETAELFRPLALAAKLSLLPFADDRVFDTPSA
jgi:two-component system, NtrC family, sensor kinase